MHSTDIFPTYKRTYAVYCSKLKIVKKKQDEVKKEEKNSNVSEHVTD